MMGPIANSPSKIDRAPIEAARDAGEATSVLLPDDGYDADPVPAGVRTRLVWSASDERRLAA